MTQNPASLPVVGSDRQLDRPTCLTLLASGSLGRLVFTDRALPDVLPVPYRMDGEHILIRLAVGSTASRASQGTVVAFTVDEFDAATRSGWSVTAVGYAHEIVEPQAQTKMMLTELVSWQGDAQTSLVSISTDKLTGSRLVAMR